MSEYDDVVERLAAIEEELRDRAYERLTEVASAGDDDVIDNAKAQEKKLLQARRAIARAIAALSD
jgi:hypothetical protein